MREATTLNPGTDGDEIATEALPEGVRLPVSKVVLGAIGVDDGDVAHHNPMPTRDDAICSLLLKTNELLEMILQRL